MHLSADEASLFREGVSDFKRAMNLRGQINLRVARRVTFILRLGMISFGVFTVILVLMLFAFTSRMGDMITALDTMNRHFTSMSQDMGMLRNTIVVMESRVEEMQTMANHTTHMNGSVDTLSGQMRTLSSSVSEMRGDIAGITQSVQLMQGQFRHLAPSVQRLGVDVDRMSGPMKLFNDLNPIR